MTTGLETLVDHEIGKEINPHLTGDGEVKSVVVVTTKEMIEDLGILEVGAQEGHLDPQAVGRTTMVAEMKIEEETQKRTDARTVAVKNMLQVTRDARKDKSSAFFVSRSTMTMKIVTIARMPLLANSVEVTLITNLRIAHDGSRINFGRKRMTSVVLAKKGR